MEDIDYSSNESEDKYELMNEKNTPLIPAESVSSTQSISKSLFSHITTDSKYEVSGDIGEISPTFGDVLLSIGKEIVESQAIFDKGLVDSVRKLSETKMKIVSEVIQELNEDGLPDVNQTEIIENDVPLIHFVNPTVHAWKHVALSMDLSIGAMDHEKGMRFNKKQGDIVDSGSAFIGDYQEWFHVEREQSDVKNKIEENAGWKRGQIRMDALIQPRLVERFSHPSEVAIGPQIYFSHGTVNEKLINGEISERSVDLLIRIRKADGEVNPNVDIHLETGPFQSSYYTEEGYSGSRTNQDGEIKVRLSRKIPNYKFLRPIKNNVTAHLGEVKHSTVVSL